MVLDPKREVAFNPADPAFLADPYPTYAELRRTAPVAWAPGLGVWVVSRHADVAALLRDPRLGVTLGNDKAFKGLPGGVNERLQVLMKMFEHQMLFHDPPQHTRLRGLVNKTFTPKVVDTLRPEMERMVLQMLEDVAAAGSMDLIADLAFPLPVAVIAALLGVPAEDHARFKGWSQALVVTLEPVLSERDLEEASRAAGEILDYFRSLVARKRAQPENDLLSALIEAEEQGNRLSTDELLSNAVLLLVAGHETTVNLIGNGALALLRHRDQMDRLYRESALIESAVEELLRYDSPVQMTSRIAHETLSLGGQVIERGEEVLMLVGSANRDAERFSDPDRLDLARADNRHLSFGGGPHYCIGAPLARAEGQIAFRSLLNHFPDLELAAEDPPRRPSAVLRGLRQLPVRFRPRTR